MDDSTTLLDDAYPWGNSEFGDHSNPVYITFTLVPAKKKLNSEEQ